MDFYTPINYNFVVKGRKQSNKVFLGSLFPGYFKKNILKILIPKKNKDNNVVFSHVNVKESNFKKIPIKFDKNFAKHILFELYNYKYSWGGLNKGRDCSSTIKDFFTPFGIWLPRDSKQQKNYGKKINLIGSEKDKLNTILNKGIPFLSTIYKKGH